MLKMEKVSQSDLDEVIRFAIEVFTEEQHIPDQMVPISEERDPIWWCAKADGHLIGVSAAWKETGQWHWGRFAIDKKMRGLGIGKKMASFCLNEIFLLGAENIFMEARDITVKLLEPFGTEITGEPMDFFGEVVTPINIKKEVFLKNKVCNHLKIV